MTSKFKKYFFIFVTIGVIVLACTTVWDRYFYYPSVDDIKQSTMTRLTKIREEKKKEILNFLSAQRTVAEKLGKQYEFVDKYKQLLDLYNENQLTSDRYKLLEREMEEYYVTRLGAFYDVIFVDNKGDFFFTVKQESDYLKNYQDKIFDGLDLRTSLKDKSSQIQYVDFQFYNPSNEPASFFVVPILVGEKILGKVLLQLPLNPLNMRLKNLGDVGRTCEVYLVNQEHILLTESRFIDGLVLNKKIKTDAIRDSVLYGSGNKIIDDYRGKRVFSAYECFSFLDGKWFIVAEIDEDEVLTKHYLQWEKKLFSEMLGALRQDSTNENDRYGKSRGSLQNRQTIRVDLAEYGKATNEEILYTAGVATCTAFGVYMPNKVGYLAHITPTDNSYKSSMFDKFASGEYFTDLVSGVMEQLTWFDITPSELSKVQFVLSATQPNGLRGAIRDVLQYGTDLSQIKVLYVPETTSGDVVIDYVNNEAWFYWHDQTEVKRLSTYNTVSLAELMKNTIGYES